MVSDWVVCSLLDQINARHLKEAGPTIWHVNDMLVAQKPEPDKFITMAQVERFIAATTTSPRLGSIVNVKLLDAVLFRGAHALIKTVDQMKKAKIRLHPRHPGPVSSVTNQPVWPGVVPQRCSFAVLLKELGAMHALAPLNAAFAQIRPNATIVEAHCSVLDVLATPAAMQALACKLLVVDQRPPVYIGGLMQMFWRTPDIVETIAENQFLLRDASHDCTSGLRALFVNFLERVVAADELDICRVLEEHLLEVQGVDPSLCTISEMLSSRSTLLTEMLEWGAAALRELHEGSDLYPTVARSKLTLDSWHATTALIAKAPETTFAASRSLSLAEAREIYDVSVKMLDACNACYGPYMDDADRHALAARLKTFGVQWRPRINVLPLVRDAELAQCHDTLDDHELFILVGQMATTILTCFATGARVEL
eukprot:SAG11_NODE_321_length_10781_cov_6.440835_2_plen_425_part_00